MDCRCDQRCGKRCSRYGMVERGRPRKVSSIDTPVVCSFVESFGTERDEVKQTTSSTDDCTFLRVASTHCTCIVYRLQCRQLSRWSVFLLPSRQLRSFGRPPSQPQSRTPLSRTDPQLLHHLRLLLPLVDPLQRCARVSWRSSCSTTRASGIQSTPTRWEMACGE